MIIEGTIPAVRGFATCIGFTHPNEFPYRSGNRFFFNTLGEGEFQPPCDGLFCLNMYAENFDEICRRLDLKKITVLISVRDMACCIIDKRIDEEWYSSLYLHVDIFAEELNKRGFVYHAKES